MCLDVKTDRARDSISRRAKWRTWVRRSTKEKVCVPGCERPSTHTTHFQAGQVAHLGSLAVPPVAPPARVRPAARNDHPLDEERPRPEHRPRPLVGQCSPVHRGVEEAIEHPADVLVPVINLHVGEGMRT